MIKETIDESLFLSRFKDYGRQENFSANGLRSLFEYLEQLSEDCGQDIELDVVALCCDYSECSISELWSDYEHLFEDLSRDDFESDEELNKAMIEVLNEHTQVIEVEHYEEASTYILEVF